MNKPSNFLKNFRLLFVSMFVSALLLELFLTKTSDDLLLLGLTLFWILTVLGFRLESRFSILGTLIFLLSAAFFLMIRLQAVAEKLAVWAYLFLVVGIVQRLIEERKRPKELKDIESFLSSLKNYVKSKTY